MSEIRASEFARACLVCPTSATARPWAMLEPAGVALAWFEPARRAAIATSRPSAAALPGACAAPAWLPTSAP